jgi:UDP-N-acetylmuramoyl-L-alanyl-D-glutamate--2,6-diaminopimelate ligase
MQLSTLLSEIEPLSVAGDCPIDQVAISSVEVDAERVRAGTLFVAMPFWLGDRRNNLSRALTLGAAAIIAEHPTLLAHAPIGILVNDCCLALGKLLSAFHRHPSRSMTVLAVTGTQGKTTVTHLLRHILCATGRRTEAIGTLGASVGGKIRDTGYTTPPAETLQPLLAEMRSAGATHVCIEASSEGLALHRLAGTTVAVGGLTNLTRDHLDFHGDVAAYAKAKAILFRELAQRACFNVDDPHGEQFHRAFRGERLSVSTAGHVADLVLTTRQVSMRGSLVEVRYGIEFLRFMLPLPGAHNVENAAVALGMSILAGVCLSDGAQALEEVLVPPGRLEKIGDRPRVLVDFAHTPSALRRVLTELKTLAPARLVCVFGAGGNRDPGKRPAMGQAVSELADVALYLLQLAHLSGIDLEEAVLKKIEVNKTRKWDVEK